MKKRNFNFYIRKSHRYLGVFIGIQFLLWTLGGLYFSWTDIDQIHGDDFKKEKTDISFNKDFTTPKIIITEIENTHKAMSIQNMRVIEISGEPFYEFLLKGEDKREKLIVADAITGKIRKAISEDEARKIALAGLSKPLEINEVVYLTEKNIGGHHEYREKPLPAWAVTFENNLTVYLSAETGQIGAFRTTRWRIFDFLWMLHTMDFNGRDNINNYVLRGFSILGIVTVFSGFLLFFISSKYFRNLIKR